MPSIARQRLGTEQISAALGDGWWTFRAIPDVSIAFSAVFALIGLLLPAQSATGPDEDQE